MFKLSQILDFLVYSSIYISLGAAGLTYVLFKFIGAGLNYVILIPFAIIFAIYTFNKKTDIEEDALSDSKKTEFNRNYNAYFLALALAGYGLIAILSFAKGITYGVAVLAPFIIGFLYSRGISSESKSIRLKDFLFLKNIVVSATWTFVAVALPALFLNIPLTPELYFLGFIVFLRLLINTIFFDIKDLKSDSTVETKTIPVVYGLSFTNKLLIFLNASFAYVLLVFYLMPAYNPLLMKIGFFSAAYGFFYILLYNLNLMEINLLSNFIVDGELIAIGLFTYLITSF